MLPAKLQVFSEAEEVRFGKSRSDGALAALAAGLCLRRDRPRILRGDGDVDDAVVRHGGYDGRRFQKLQRTQVPLCLGQPLGTVDVAFPEEEKLPDYRSTRVDVEPVGELIQLPVARFVG